MIEFDPVEHAYTVEGRRVPSVTQILSVLDNWEWVPREAMELAAQFGTHVHEAAALLVRDQLDWDSLDDALVLPMRGLQKFLDESGAVVVQSEQRVYHPGLRYAGTLDVTLHWRGGMALADFKTGSAPPRSVGPQTWAYAEALAAMGGPKIKRRYCIRLLGGDYKVDKLDDPRDGAIFTSCLNIYRFKHGV